MENKTDNNKVVQDGTAASDSTEHLTDTRGLVAHYHEEIRMNLSLMERFSWPYSRHLRETGGLLTFYHQEITANLFFWERFWWPNLNTNDLSTLYPGEKYDMKNKRRGQALIFNQVNFKQKQLDVRDGSDVDCSALVERLRHLGFEVQAFKDQTKKQVEEIISNAANGNHSDADCFLVVFMSHGEDDHVHTYDREISIKDITDEFKGTNCESLVGKPKIFIWQACRGNEYDDPVTPCAIADEETNDMRVGVAAIQTLPAGADFIMCYSVAKGYYSYRHRQKGSWFIQDLCKVLKMYGDHLELTHLLTLVNRKVSERSVVMSGDANAIGKKQVPCFASMLTKKLYLHPKQ